MKGELVGPADGLAGIATNNLTAPSDGVVLASGPVRLCPSGKVPDQGVSPVPATISPLDPLKIRVERPVARASLDTVTTKTAVGVVPVNVTTSVPGVVVAPKAPMFSLFMPTTIDLSGLRDVLGGSLGLSTVTTVVPTEVVADRSFASAPPVNSWVGSPLTVSAGVLRIGGSGEVVFALALGAESGKTKLRLRHRIDCSSWTSGSWSLGLVAPDATGSVITRSCAMTLTDDVIPLPGTGPWMLVARRSSSATPPCWYAGGSPNHSTYELDQVTFE